MYMYIALSAHRLIIAAINLALDLGTNHLNRL